MDPATGTDPLEGTSGEWFIVREADCSEEDNDTFEDIFEGNTQESFVSDLLDDSQQEQGNSLQLFHQLEQNESERELSHIKRKLLLTPESKDVAELSPRLGAVALSPRTQNPPKRRLFTSSIEDSGLEATLDETASPSEELQVDGDIVDGPRDIVNAEAGPGIPKVNRLLDVLHAKNIRVTLLHKFKNIFDLSFTDITRPFRSDKTCYTDWVCVLFGLLECHEAVLKTVVKNQCDFLYLKMVDSTCLFLARFKTHKSRETLRKMLKVTLDVPEHQVLLEPPRTNGVAAALYWYKNGLSENAFVHGPYPEWIMRQTVITGEAAQHQFSLADMIQWAYDHDLTEEPKIAYEYALLAQEDMNASAWLKCNSQARFVKECSQMVRYYKNAEMMEMTMSEWIRNCCRRVKEENGGGR